MRRKVITTIVLTCILCISMCMPLFAAKADSAGNIIESGEMVSLSDNPFFGAWVFGQDIAVNNAKAKGSVGAAGKTVTIDNSSIGETLYAAGETISLKDTDVHGNVYMAGNNVAVAEKTTCNGVYLAGNDVTFKGITNALNAAGKTVKVNGTVNGDASIKAEKVEVAPGTVVTGNLKISAQDEPTIPETARIGNYTFDKIEDKEEASESRVSPISKKMIKTIYWIAAMVALGIVICWFFNEHLSRAAEYIKTRPGSFIGSGIGGFFLVPIVALLLCCTFVLAPVGVITLFFYGIFVFAGVSFAGASLPRLILPKLNVFLTTLLGVTILQGLRSLPYAGPVIGVLAGMYLLGYVIQYLWTKRLGRSKKQDEYL